MKILQIAAPAPAGGLERVVQGLAVGMCKLGHDARVAAVLPGGAEAASFVNPLAEAGVPVHEIPVPVRGYRRERHAVRELCRELLPDVVHTHGYRVDLVDRPVAAALGIPTVTTVHGPSMIGGIKGALYEWLQRRNYRRFDAVLAVSQPLYDETLADGVPAERLHRIPNAWAGLYDPLTPEQARQELDLPLDVPVVGWVGRLIPVKACDVFLEALHRLKPPRPVVAIIGHGPEAKRIRDMSSSLGLESHVRIYSDITDAGRLFGAFDTYVLSSRSEGVPIVVLEAIAAETPIVATRVGGIPDLLADDRAWVVPPDDPIALAGAIQESLRDRGLAIRRAKRASELLNGEYGPDSWLRRHEEVYQQVSSSVTVHE